MIPGDGNAGNDGFAVAAELAALKQVFRPASPVDDRELFKGRQTELARVISAVQELGQHAVIFGERGIGKTSLAYMAMETFKQVAPASGLALRIPCSADDNFATVWRKLPARLVAQTDVMEDADTLLKLTDRAEDILDQEEVSPELVARALNVVSSKVPLLVVIDEFDRIGDWGSTQLFADLIKTLSDDLVRATLVIVGVADDIDGLMQGHRSVERALRQISMPRMTEDELSAIVQDGFSTFGRRSGRPIDVEDSMVHAIVRMSQGFPYFTHLLSGAVGEMAILKRELVIRERLLPEALRQALNEVAQGIKISYTDAVSSSKATAQFDQTLLACALAEVDALGFFAPADVRAPLSTLSERQRDTPSFLHHLKRFTDDPSRVLETRGEGRRMRYRFRNPLMRPFVIIKGVQDGYLDAPTGRHRRPE